MVARIRSNYDLEARYSRLRARGMLTLAEIAKRLGIAAATAKTWRRAGLLRSHRYNDRGETLFEQPGPNTPTKYHYQRKNRANSMASAVGRNSINS
jgi:transposase